MLSPIRLFILALVCAYSSAQHLKAEATCRDEFDWMYSSLPQSPCDVAYELASVCLGGTKSNPYPLAPGYSYIGPTPTYSNRCLCSSVYYSLISACGYCQGRDYISWGWFTGNCTQRYHQVFPEPIPVGVRVQHWAYQDVESSGTFNVTLAQSLRGGAESTRLPTATPSYTNPPSNNSNVPIIVGVVVGVVGLVLIGGLCAFFLIRRKKRRSRSSNGYKRGLLKTSNSHDMARDSPAPTTFSPPISPGKLYDPNDPSTYPAMTSIPSSSSPDSLSYRHSPFGQNLQPSEQNPAPAMAGRNKGPLPNSYFGPTPEL